MRSNALSSCLLLRAFVDLKPCHPCLAPFSRGKRQAVINGESLSAHEVAT